MSLLSRGLRSALGARTRASLPTQAARFESTDAPAAAPSDAAPAAAPAPAADKPKRAVSFEDRQLEQRIETAERKRNLKQKEKTIPRKQQSWNAPYFQHKEQQADWDVSTAPQFKWDEPSSAGYMRIQQLEEMRSLMSKSELDRPALKAHWKHFQPPKGQIRVTRTIDLSDPESPLQQKAVLLTPVSALPLEGADALQRFKLLAGPRWTPGMPGRLEAEPVGGAGKDGYFKLSEETYETVRMNRKSASDMLERLVAAANDKNSPLPADTPVDTRHIVARTAKRRGGTRNDGGRAAWLKRNPHTVGGVKGFPIEWLSHKKQELFEPKQQRTADQKQ